MFNCANASARVLASRRTLRLFPATVTRANPPTTSESLKPGLGVPIGVTSVLVPIKTRTSSASSTIQPSRPPGVRMRHHVKPSLFAGPSRMVTVVPFANLSTMEKPMPGPERTLARSPSVVFTNALPPTIKPPVLGEASSVATTSGAERSSGKMGDATCAQRPASNVSVAPSARTQTNRDRLSGEPVQTTLPMLPSIML